MNKKRNNSVILFVISGVLLVAFLGCFFGFSSKTAAINEELNAVNAWGSMYLAASKRTGNITNDLEPMKEYYSVLNAEENRYRKMALETGGTSDYETVDLNRLYESYLSSKKSLERAKEKRGKHFIKTIVVFILTISAFVIALIERKKEKTGQMEISSYPPNYYYQ